MQTPQMNGVQITREACEGEKTLPILIDFSLGQSFTLDLGVIQSQGYIASVQTIYVDNETNTSPVIVQCGVSRQRFSVPAGACAFVSLLQPNPPVLNFICVNPVQVLVQIMNFYLPTFVWGGGGITATQAVADAILDATVSAGKVQVLSQPAGDTLVDFSGTITLGGTAQQVLAANAARKRFIVHNPSTATEILQMMFGAAGAGRINLIAGQTWDDSNSTVAQNAIFLIAATTAHAFTCYEG